MKFIETFEGLPQWAKIVLLLCVGLISASYRILKYLESKNELTLLVGVLAVVPGVGQVVSIIDVISEVQSNKLSFHVD